jgi:hypothetical protein
VKTIKISNDVETKRVSFPCAVFVPAFLAATYVQLSKAQVTTQLHIKSAKHLNFCNESLNGWRDFEITLQNKAHQWVAEKVSRGYRS